MNTPLSKSEKDALVVLNGRTFWWFDKIWKSLPFTIRPDIAAALIDRGLAFTKQTPGAQIQPGSSYSRMMLKLTKEGTAQAEAIAAQRRRA